MKELLLLALAAATTENLVYCRGLDHTTRRSHEQHLREVLVIGGTAVVLTILAACCGWLGRYLTTSVITLLTWTRPALLIALYGVAVVLVMVGVNFAMTALEQPPAKMMTKLVYGFTPMGTLFIVGSAPYTFSQSLFYGIGAGVGFLLALLVNVSIQRRMEHSDIPLVFRGMPATLLTFAMLSLALYGLLGHPLVA